MWSTQRINTWLPYVYYYSMQGLTILGLMPVATETLLGLTKLVKKGYREKCIIQKYSILCTEYLSF
jgi:uncharacterized membrane protein YesL